MIWLLAILTQLMLSSKVLHLIMGVVECKGRPFVLRSSIRWMMPITSRRAEESAIYSASVVLRATKDCTLLFHRIGQPAYEMTKPVRE